MPIRIRLLLLRCLRDAGHPLIAALTGILLVHAVLPAATALATAATIDRLGPGGLRGTAVPLAVLGVTIVVGQAGGALMQPMIFLAKARIDGAHRVRVATMAAAAPTISALELPRVQDLIKATSADPLTWVERTPSDGAVGQLFNLTRYVGLAASAAVVAQYSWWLIPALAVPALAVRVLTGRQWVNHFRIWLRGLPEQRNAAYWAEVATTPAEARELRVFGFGDWLVGRQQRHVNTHLAPVWIDDYRASRGKWLHALITFVPLSAIFMIVGTRVAATGGSIALETAVLTAAWSVYSVLGMYDPVSGAGATPVIEAFEELRGLLGDGAAAQTPAAADQRSTDQRSTDQRSTDQRPRPAPVPLVRFERVSFSYPGTDRLVLDQLDLTIRPGELLAIVGRNGAGKSTLTKLLAGLYEPDAGHITAAGLALPAQPSGGLAAWRRQLSVVFQDFVKYQLSARDNVTLGAGIGYDQAALEAAAKESGLSTVIDRLPDGWDTPLSRGRTGGVDLSGGQWQQLVLTRALYAVRTGARLLVLDEPTAHLDVRTEFEVFDRLITAARDVSVVLISHRLSTVRRADRIVLLADGRIAESGSHAELMALGGDYASLFAIQAERFNQGYQDRIEEGELV
ncbi:MAG: ATP-binding cassette domain-containing protein [Dactylosporangium sp.]|nr:ATP-binding cassette domain-containing protein [Dactylosporangium sp.]NNJ62688.1 ATP-binding cassette domain-containing protein [Dactylosporangium sp.]